MKIVVCMLDFGCRCIGRSTLWQDQSPGQTTLLQEELCYAPPIPIERKSCLVIPRLQHVRSLTPRAAAAVSRTDRRLTCTASLAAAKGLDVPPCYGSLRSKPGAALGRLHSRRLGRLARPAARPRMNVESPSLHIHSWPSTYTVRQSKERRVALGHMRMAAPRG
ncbi:UNVERIFIED_CONTAM: hypothetical protein Scaly_3113800 [Sesamum calycinum]|uniref:Uncharacterized protein n=1 Tax=Sesamum calycinum TaxID=2727403 RepID=A0AAW2JK74_9LAMI